MGQPKRIIVVSEKGTVRGTLAPVLDELEVDFLPIGGYASATRVWDLAREGDRAQPLLLLYLGDHDPSGRGMSDRTFPDDSTATPPSACPPASRPCWMVKMTGR